MIPFLAKYDVLYIFSGRIPIISHRADLRVFFLKDNWGYKVALAASETIEMPNPHLPLRVHLALTGTPG